MPQSTLQPDGREKVQLHLVLEYKFEVGQHPNVKALLEQGYQVAQMQRLTDREVLVTLIRPAG